MAQSNKLPWPKPFLGLRETTWANAPREVAAGITLAATLVAFAPVEDPLRLQFAVAISRANASMAALLAQYHLLDLIGENRLYPTNRHAIAAFRQEHEQPERET